VALSMEGELDFATEEEAVKVSAGEVKCGEVGGVCDGGEACRDLGVEAGSEHLDEVELRVVALSMEGELDFENAEEAVKVRGLDGRRIYR